MRKTLKSSPKSRILSIIYSIFLISLPPLLYFSYFPIISLGENSTMNFELSLPLLWLVLFDLFALFLLIKTRPPLKFASIWSWLLFPIFLTCSVAWSLNPLRGFLTAGILWLIYFAVFSFFDLRKTLLFPKNFSLIFWRVFFASSLLIAVWCWLQSVLDLTGLPQSITLMCDGCTTIMFGLPHPNGFAIEPQFMGNLLLAPTLLAAWFIFSPGHHLKIVELRKSHHSSKASDDYHLNFELRFYPIFRYLAFFFLAATLFFTLSRGAIYAFLIGLIVLTALTIYRAKSPRFLLAWLFVAFAFLFTLNLQGIMAERGPTSDTYQTGIAKVIHQLSLGLIDFRDPATSQTSDTILGALSVAPTSSPEDTISSSPETTPSSSESPPSETTLSLESFPPEESISPAPTPVFDGYIQSSTNARLNLTISALYIWQTSPNFILFGVGLGGAGQALYDFDQSPAPKEIVQNEYASLLLETGLMGCLFALFTLYLIFRLLRASPLKIPLLALLAAYAISLFFFSGLANALQIYLLPPLFFFIASLGQKSVI